MKNIEEKTEFLNAVKFDFNERREIEEILSWIVENPDMAAMYIVWLEGVARKNY